MQERGIKIYVVPTSDFHESEYVGEHFKARAYITGFTGSAGTAVITQSEAGLWTDGRYFIQARKQLQDTTVKLFEMGTEGVPTVEEYIAQTLKEKDVLGFDGRVVNTMQGKRFAQLAGQKGASLYTKEDLIGKIWKDRPELSCCPVWVLEDRYSGETVESKLARVRKEMAKCGAKAHILSSLYDIAWLFNIRGDDIVNVPVVLSFVILTQDACHLFIQGQALTEETETYFAKKKITIHAYEEIYDAVAQLKETPVLFDENVVNYRIATSIPKQVEVLHGANPTYAMKAVKNETELENTRLAHIRDGVAVTKFMYWLKTQIKEQKITELSAAEYLKQRRMEQEHFLDLSFHTISAYGENAAMMHYSATPESNATLEPRGFLLVDSGGHYLEGTTDITRTFALGELTAEQIRHYTAVCRSNIRLASAKFLYGCNGQNLDILARGPIWDMGIDYRCGTGHGVGHILNVHEGPNGFRWRKVAERNDSGVLEAGMITTDEPGVYLDGRYGIRIENELICRQAEKNEYGQFMEFEVITMAPIDLDAIDPEQMEASERKALNAYHQMVYEKISPFLTEEEREWLKVYTREI